jgi:hypothetical protein
MRMMSVSVSQQAQENVGPVNLDDFVSMPISQSIGTSMPYNCLILLRPAN